MTSKHARNSVEGELEVVWMASLMLLSAAAHDQSDGFERYKKILRATDGSAQNLELFVFSYFTMLSQYYGALGDTFGSSAAKVLAQDWASYQLDSEPEKAEMLSYVDAIVTDVTSGNFRMDGSGGQGHDWARAWVAKGRVDGAIGAVLLVHRYLEHFLYERDAQQQPIPRALLKEYVAEAATRL